MKSVVDVEFNIGPANVANPIGVCFCVQTVRWLATIGMQGMVQQIGDAQSSYQGWKK